MAVLGLHFGARAFSSCGKWGPLFIAVRAPLIITASLVAEHRLQTCRLSNCGSRGLVAPRHVGSSQTRARTRVPCIGRQILNHCATREALYSFFDWVVFFFLILSCMRCLYILELILCPLIHLQIFFPILRVIILSCL